MEGEQRAKSASSAMGRESVSSKIYKIIHYAAAITVTAIRAKNNAQRLWNDKNTIIATQKVLYAAKGIAYHAAV